MSDLPYANLRVWKKAHELTLRIYRISANMPSREEFGLKGQMRRSSSSVATNIVEGIGRNTKKDTARFLRMARASALETSYHCLLAQDLCYFEINKANELIAEYQGLSAGLAQFINKIK